MSIASKVQIWVCGGSVDRVKDGEEVANLWTYSEKVSDSIMCVNDDREKKVGQEWNSPGYNYSYGSVGSYTVTCKFKFIYFEKRNAGFWPYGRVVVKPSFPRFNALQASPENGFDPFVAVRYEFSRKLGSPLEQTYWGAGTGQWYMGDNGRIKIPDKSTLATKQLIDFECDLSCLAPFMCSYYLDGSDTVRAGYKPNGLATVNCISDLHMARKREFRLSVAATRYRDNIIALEDSYHWIMNSIELHSNTLKCNTCSEVIYLDGPKTVRALVRLAKCLLIRNFLDAAYSYPSRSDDFALYTQVCKQVERVFDLQPPSPGAEANFFATGGALLDAGGDALATAVHTLQTFELAFGAFFCINNKYKTPVEPPNTTVYEPGYDYTVHVTEIVFHDGKGEDYSLQQTFNTVKKYSPPHTQIDSSNPVVFREQAHTVTSHVHRKTMSDWNEKVAAEYHRVLETCLRVSGVFAYVCRYIIPKDKKAHQHKVDDVVSCADGWRDVENFQLRGVGTRTVKQPQTWNEENKARHAERMARGVGQSFVDFDIMPQYYICFPFDYDRRDILHFDMDYDDRVEKKKRDKDKERKKGDETEFCDDAENHRHQTRTIVYDKTRHKLTTYGEIADERKRLAELEDKVKAASDNLYDLGSLVLADTGIGEVMVAVGPEAKFFLKQIEGQIDPCDNTQDLKDDAIDWAAERTGGAIIDGVGGLHMDTHQGLVAEQGFVKGGEPIGSIKPKEMWHPIARADEDGLLARGSNPSPPRGAWEEFEHFMQHRDDHLLGDCPAHLDFP